MASNAFSTLVDDSSDDGNIKSTSTALSYEQRKWIYRNNNNNNNNNNNQHQFKVISYNILADGENLALSSKHDYCSLELRRWELRFKKIKYELSLYDPDIICLQEILPNAFLSDFQPYLDEEGYLGTYSRDPNSGNYIAVSTFVKKSMFKIISEKNVNFSNMIEKGVHSGKFKKKLEKLRESVLLQLLKHKTSGNLILNMNTHIHWNPSYPNVKAQQCEFACKAAIKFLKESCGGLEIEKDNIGVVFAGDFNSIRNVQLHFLPTIQQQWYKHNEEKNKLGGAYQLLSTGTLPQTHPEHPDSFAKSTPPIIATKETTSNENPRKKKTKKNQPVYVGMLQTNLDFNHVYKDFKIPFTTKCPDFQGPLDYLFFTRKTLECKGYLEMPYALKTDNHNGNNDNNNNNNNNNEKPTSNDFPYIPDAVWPSDHLAIGGIFEFKIGK